MTIMNGLFRVTKHEIKAATATLVQAFFEYPEPVFLMPDPEKRRKQMPRIYDSIMKGALSIGEIWAASPEMEGVAVWAPGNGSRPVWKHGFSFFWLLMNLRVGSTASGSREAYFAHVTEVRERLMPGNYWYLQMVGVKPAMQGKGCGSSLLRPMLARATRENLPVYLETQSESTVPLYEHFGFTVADDSLVIGTNIRSWAMIKTPDK